MPFPRPDQLDYDEDLYEELEPRKKGVLHRLYNVFVKGTEHYKAARSAYNKDPLRKILASEFEEETHKYLDRYEKLKEENVRLRSAKDYLNDHHQVEREKLDIDSRHELLVLLYEEDLIDELDDLIARTSIRAYSTKRSYTLDQKIDLSGLDEKISKFHQFWNVEMQELRPLRVKINARDGEDFAVLRFYKEYSEKPIDVFKFREEASDEVPAEPSVTKVQKRPLKNMRFRVEKADGQTELTFTDSLQGWQRPLNVMFSTVFDVDEITEEISEKKFEAVEEMEEEIATGMGEAEDPVDFVHESIDERKDKAKNRVEKMNIPDEERKELKDKLDTLEMSGGGVSDDQSTSTEEFRLVAFSLEDLFNSVDGIRESFQDWLQKADRENQAFVLTIDDRPVRVKDGTWKAQGQGGISDANQKALEIFFGEASVDENADD